MYGETFNKAYVYSTTAMPMAEKPERLDIRLSEEEKKRLAELAKEKGVSMTDLVRTWIVRGDVVHVLAEQLQDFVKDFDKWHVSENRRSSVRFLCQDLQGRLADMEDETKRRILYDWIGFYQQSFELLKLDISILRRQTGTFIKLKYLKERTMLIGFILEFTKTILSYHDIFIQGFLKILENMSEKTKRSIGQTYNDEVRTRYNEIASKFEDFLKRAQRELGEGLEHTMPRAKEFRAKE